MRVGIVALSAALAVPSQALPVLSAAQVSSLSQRAICVVRARTDKAAAAEATLIVPPSEASRLAAQGFSVTPCGSRLVDFAQYKETACDLAQGNDAVQARTKSVMGQDAREMCASAKALLPDADTAVTGK